MLCCPRPSARVFRRRRFALSFSLSCACAASALLVACGGDDDSAEDDRDQVSVSAPKPTNAAGGGIGGQGPLGGGLAMPSGGVGGGIAPGPGPSGPGPAPGAAGGAPNAGTGGAPGTSGSSGPPPETCVQCWTYLGRDTRSTFSNTDETKLTVANAASLKERWMFMMPGSATGTAAVVDGGVYAPSMGGVVAFDAASGTVKWMTPQSVSGSVTYDAGKLYVQSSAGLVTQLDAATGKAGWSTPVGSFGGFGTPLVVGNKVLVGASSGEENLVADNAMFRGRALALDKVSGQILWQHATAVAPANGAAIWSSPAADAELGLAYFTTGNNYTGTAGDQSDSIIALDLESGSLMWKYQATANDVYTTVNFGPGPDHDFGSNPIVFDAGGKKLVGAGQKSGTFWALDRMTGAKVWSQLITPGCGIGGIFNNGAFDGQRILVSSWPCNGPATLKALEPATGNVLWQVTLPSQSWAPITVANGVGFVASQNALNSFELATGKLLGKHMVGGSIASAAVVVDGSVYFGSGVPPLAGSFGSPMDDKVFHALGLP
jgi:polyvinyl alcohol dehydrogenase (cytochrome)